MGLAKLRPMAIVWETLVAMDTVQTAVLRCLLSEGGVAREETHSAHPRESSLRVGCTHVFPYCYLMQLLFPMLFS